MDRTEPDWNLYRTFLTVIRTGSLSSAARATGSTQPTVGRQIEALEAALGAKLFTRSQRGLVPTQIGRELVLHAESMAAAAAALRRSSSSGASDEAGTVRLTAGAHFGIEVLPQILATFARQHADIELELSVSSSTEDLLRRDADIAVRLARPTQKALIARRLGNVKIGLFAHRSYLEAHGLPRSVSEALSHRLIGFDRETHILAAFGGPAAKMRREDFAFRTDNVTAQLALLRAGLGIAACHAGVARRDPSLVAVLAGEVSFEREVWLVMHPDLKKIRRVRLLFEHLTQGLRDYLRGPR